MNSFRHVERALEFEIGRQISLLEDGGSVIQETLLWDAEAGEAVSMRSKEEAHDYRYFPDPDLVPVLVDEPWLSILRAAMPELPVARRDRYCSELGLPRYDADVLTAEHEVAEYFEHTLQALGTENSPAPRDLAKSASNWVMTEVLRVVGEQKVRLSGFPVSPERLAAMIRLIADGTISGKLAKEVFEEMLESREEPAAIVSRKGLVQVSDTSLIEASVNRVLEQNEDQVKKYLAGNEKIFGYFVGETMKAMQGKANPKVVNELLRQKLSQRKA